MTKLSYRIVTSRLQSQVVEIQCITSKILKTSNELRTKVEKKSKRNIKARQHKTNSRIEFKRMKNQNNYTKFFSLLEGRTY
jgi:hypothetical protein